MDDDDNDPARFLAHLVAAFQTVQSDLGRAALAAQEVLPSPARPGQREGLSNRQLAQRLVVYLATVKWHTWKFYG